MKKFLIGLVILISGLVLTNEVDACFGGRGLFGRVFDRVRMVRNSGLGFGRYNNNYVTVVSNENKCIEMDGVLYTIRPTPEETQ